MTRAIKRCGFTHSTMRQELDLTDDTHAVPYPAIKEVLDYLEYGNVIRVMFEMLAITGCRISELDKFKMSELYGGVIYWKPAKRQPYRKEQLPAWYIKELLYYRKNNRVYQNKIFGISANTFRRYFNRDVRPKLPSWTRVRLRAYKGALETEYILQLKGLRKTFQTHLFAQEYEKWKDANVAMEFTSKRMRHSTKHMTAYHYLENFETLDVENLKDKSNVEILANGCQKRIFDYF